MWDGWGGVGWGGVVWDMGGEGRLNVMVIRGVR